MNSKQTLSFLAIALLCVSQLSAQEAFPVTAANTNKITIDLVPVGDPNNRSDAAPGDPSSFGFGSVDKEYQIGKYDVTVEQYCAFLNAVASKSDPHQLYDERMTTDPDVACITRSGDKTTGYTYQPMSDSCKKFPITYVNLFSAFRFCNWLENGQPVGKETPETTERGAYFPAYGCFIPTPNSKWNIPTENQWYKAAYYSPVTSEHCGSLYYSYGTSSAYEQPSNSLLTPDAPNEANYCLYGVFTTSEQPRLTPVGTFTHSASPCGAYDMAGNVNQWTTTPLANEGLDACKLIVRRGSWASTDAAELRFMHCFCNEANARLSTLGFRVVYNEAALKKKSASSWWWPL